MISSEYIPINKKKYVHQLITLEAENKALTEKINAYEEILKTKFNEMINVDAVDVSDYPPEIRQDAEVLFFKKNAYSYLQSPDKNDALISPIVNHILNKRHTPQLTGEDIKKFLKFF